MRTFRFLHAADLRLDSPFTGVGQAPAPIMEVLQNASIRAWDNLVDLAIEKRVNFVLITGDVYEGSQNGLRAQKRLLKGIERLAERRIQTVLVPGSQDKPSNWSLLRIWPSSVTVIDRTGGRVTVIKDGVDALATFHTFSAVDLAESDSALREAINRDSDGIHIGLLPTLPKNDFVENLKLTNIGYWSIMRDGAPFIIHRESPWIVAPGSLQARAADKRESGVRGAYLVDVENGAVATVDLFPLDAVRLLQVDLDISALNRTSDIIKSLNRAAVDLRKEAPGVNLILSGNLSGAGKVHFDLRKSGVIEDLLTQLRREHDFEKPFVWWRSIDDATTSPTNPLQIVKRNDFSAQTVWTSKFLKESQEKLLKFSGESLKALEQPFVKKWISDPSPKEHQELLDQALLQSLSILEEDEHK